MKQDKTKLQKSQLLTEKWQIDEVILADQSSIKCKIRSYEKLTSFFVSLGHSFFI